MLKYKNLTVIGTSHISIESIREVEKVILETKPPIIALELDYPRFNALISNKKEKLSIRDIFKIGLKGYLFAVIGAWAEKKLGNMVGVSPGSEMKKAIELAKKNSSSISLIDQDISITLRKLSRGITWKEKMRFIFDVIRSPFVKPKIKFDLTKVPSKVLIKKLISQLRRSYPNVYKILVHDRNKVMAKNLYNLINNNHDKNIVAVIGAGHETEIISLIRKYDKH